MVHNSPPDPTDDNTRWTILPVDVHLIDSSAEQVERLATWTTLSEGADSDS